jgi:excinuclease ABC subunit A
VAAGSPHEVARVERSATGRYLREGLAIERGPRRRLGPGVRVRGARCHNLQALDVDIPAGGLIAVTGVSGSGKSTLVFDVVAPGVSRLLRSPGEGASAGTGFEPRSTGVVTLIHPFSRVASSDGLPSAAAASSTVASLTGAFDRVRALFAATADARDRGFTMRDFSLAVKGGRCESCEGQGRTRVSMDFLPDVLVPCEACGGRRFGPAILACRLGGRSIADVFDLTIAEAGRVFPDDVVARHLAPFDELGLGYLRLGQSGATLSGGERQRLHLAAQLPVVPGSGVAAGGAPTLFLFDEPTTGLHVQDVGRLLAVFDRLAAAGHTIVCVEHNLDVIRAADWVIDLGPEGGAGGGHLVAAGPPEQVAADEASWTGRALRGSCQ